MRLSAEAGGIVDRASELAADRSHKEVRAAHALLAMVDDAQGILALSHACLSRRLVRDAAGAELGAMSGPSPYRSATPVAPVRDGFVRGLARGLPFAKRRGLFETNANDLRSALLAAPESAAIVAQARFDTGAIDAFADGARVIADRYRSQFCLVEHGLLHALGVEEVRAPLARAGFDADGMTERLERRAAWRHSGVTLVGRDTLVEFTVLKANVAEVATLGLEPILADLLRREDVRKVLAAAEIEAFDLFVAFVHGARIHVDPTSAVASELRFYDDRHTTMEFVVSVLREEMDMAEDEARRAMLEVHEGDSTSIGVGKRDVRAVAKKIRARARAAGMPLRVELVPL